MVLSSMDQNHLSMKLSLLIGIVALSVCFTGCSQENEIGSDQEIAIYFPPTNSSDWERTTPENLGWNTLEIGNLNTYLETNNTRAFIVLKDGKIVIEEYYGATILGNADFNENSVWYWASAGKGLTATLAGAAQKQNLLNINDPVSDYLGTGWTVMPANKESQITIKNQLTMTTGLNYRNVDLNCTTADCLTFLHEPSTNWFYHNAPYTLLHDVIENATGQNLNSFTINSLSATGMSGVWREQGFSTMYWSTARDAARFGLLISNKGMWENEQILTPQYFNEMTATSQELNPSYGYLWWINGTDSHRLPEDATLKPGALNPIAPSDMVSALGTNAQIIDVVPSQGIIMVRLGDAPLNGIGDQ